MSAPHCETYNERMSFIGRVTKNKRNYIPLIVYSYRLGFRDEHTQSNRYKKTTDFCMESG